ncbi:hypothetical protein ACIZ62_05280 [Acetobacterium carbinolicum]|uniref:hypothetical protein n=1 Tax=Acetobacterium carbinolicum TaxID=52690 RepID=UPI0039BF363B
MKVKIQEEVFEFLNQDNTIEELLKLIEKKMEVNHLQLSHLIIDEVPIFQEYYEYLLENIKKINKIEVICNQQEGLVCETLTSTYDYFVNAVSAIKALAEVFYQNPKEEAWSSLADLFEGIQWIIETQNRIDQIINQDAITNNHSTWNEYVQLVRKIMLVLPDLEKAMENKDHVLIGDLLLYEIVPIFEESVNKLRFLIPGEGTNYVS